MLAFATLLDKIMEFLSSELCEPDCVPCKRLELENLEKLARVFLVCNTETVGWDDAGSRAFLGL